MTTFAERLAAKLQCRRGQFTDRDILLIAEEVCWDAPRWRATNDFNKSLAPFVAGLTPDLTVRTTVRVFHALPDVERGWFWEMVEAEVNADPRSRPSDPAPEERETRERGA